MLTPLITVGFQPVDPIEWRALSHEERQEAKYHLTGQLRKHFNVNVEAKWSHLTDIPVAPDGNVNEDGLFPEYVKNKVREDLSPSFKRSGDGDHRRRARLSGFDEDPLNQGPLPNYEHVQYFWINGVRLCYHSWPLQVDTSETTEKSWTDWILGTEVGGQSVQAQVHLHVRW